MSDFKIDYKLIGPQTYDRGDVGEKSKKLAKDSQRGSVTVNAPNFEEAKKKAKPLIKNSKSYERFSNRFSFDAPTKPRIKILKPLKIMFKTCCNKSFNPTFKLVKNIDCFINLDGFS